MIPEQREGPAAVDEVIDCLLSDPVARARLVERAADRLVSAQEAADMLGVSRQRVSQLAAYESFPAPASPRQGTLYWLDEVERFRDVGWSREQGRRAGS